MSKYKAGNRVGPYNILLVERFPPDSKKKYKGKFLCPFCSTKDKPKFFISVIDNVRTGNTRSCGCQHTLQREKMGKSNLKDLTGEKFGKLTVIKDSKKRDKNNHVLWLCQCSCKDKNFTLVTTSNLKDGNVQSCGCTYSIGENKIKNILEKLQINFVRQKSFENFLNPKTKRHYRFDFYLPDYNCCIEYDGIQHYQAFGWNTQENLKETKRRDKLKNNYCKNNNIYLIRIPYTDFYKINENYLLDILRINCTLNN